MNELDSLSIGDQSSFCVVKRVNQAKPKPKEARHLKQMNAICDSILDQISKDGPSKQGVSSKKSGEWRQAIAQERDEMITFMRLISKCNNKK